MTLIAPDRKTEKRPPFLSPPCEGGARGGGDACLGLREWLSPPLQPGAATDLTIGFAPCFQGTRPDFAIAYQFSDVVDD
jgi:hypothetical protein